VLVRLEVAAGCETAVLNNPKEKVTMRIGTSKLFLKNAPLF